VTVAVIFGANGFIGKWVAEAMLAQRGLDVVGAGLGTPLPGLESRWLDVDLLAGDGWLNTELRTLGPGLIVNCTGATAGSADDLIRLNVAVTAKLLEAIASSGLTTRLVHLGSAAEYGAGVVGELTAETAEAMPLSPYGAAKLAATELVTAATRGAGAGLDAVVLRVFNALGPGMPVGTMPGRALRTLTLAVADSAPLIEMGPLGSVRDFVDVRDIATAVVAACLVPTLEARIVNVGSGTGHTARELVQSLAARVGFSGEIREAAPGSPRSSDVPWQVADVSLAARVLGWRAAHDLSSAIESMTAELDGSGRKPAADLAS
jgi:nucleoside-diphosphate-sugar epimerase